MTIAHFTPSVHNIELSQQSVGLHHGIGSLLH